MSKDRHIGRIGGVLALAASGVALGSTALTWITSSSPAIAFNEQSLDAIPAGYETLAGQVAAGGAVVAVIGALIWLFRGKGATGPVLVALGSIPVVVGAIWLLLRVEDEFIWYAVNETGISTDTMTDLVGSFVDNATVTIEAGDAVLVAAFAGGIALVLGLTGLVVASSRKAGQRARVDDDRAAPVTYR